MHEFLWSAFKNWSVWVTGTGIVGLVLFFVGLWERGKRELRFSTYAAILFGFFWFFATFAAWHDSQNNLRAVIARRALDAGALGTCKANLQTEIAIRQSWQDRFADQEKTISALRAPELKQQSTINSCVVALGQLNPRLDNKFAAVPINVASGGGTYFIAILISTNRRNDLNGKVSCQSSFKATGPPQVTLKEGGTGMYGTGRADPLSDREYVISNHDTGGIWNALAPAYMNVTSGTKDIGPCRYVPLE